jgi:hypothetical protein
VAKRAHLEHRIAGTTERPQCVHPALSTLDLLHSWLDLVPASLGVAILMVVLGQSPTPVELGIGSGNGRPDPGLSGA